MRVNTTCAGCPEYLHYHGPDNTTHAFCDEPHSYLKELEREFLQAAKAEDESKVARLEKLIVQITTAAPKLAEAALVYAGWGWPVFPLKPGTKEPATRHGFKDATTSTTQIRAWWKATPTANIGLPTGHLFDVLDVDFKHGAVRVWADLRDSDAMPPHIAHGIAMTPSGGLHVFLLPSGDGNGTNMGGLPGIDYRGIGGYVVAAPSIMADGWRYEWWVKPSPMVKANVEAAAA